MFAVPNERHQNHRHRRHKTLTVVPNEPLHCADAGQSHQSADEGLLVE
jgi:hypothetical protein